MARLGSKSMAKLILRGKTICLRKNKCTRKIKTDTMINSGLYKNLIWLDQILYKN